MAKMRKSSAVLIQRSNGTQSFVPFRVYPLSDGSRYLYDGESSGLLRLDLRKHHWAVVIPKNWPMAEDLYRCREPHQRMIFFCTEIQARHEAADRGLSVDSHVVNLEPILNAIAG